MIKFCDNNYIIKHIRYFICMSSKINDNIASLKWNTLKTFSFGGKYE